MAMAVGLLALPLPVLPSEPRVSRRNAQSQRSRGLGVAAPCGLIVSTAAFDFCRGVRQRRRVSNTAVRSTVVSPFGEGTKVEEAPEKEAETTEPKPEEKPKLPLTWDNVQEVLDELRPYLKSDGGDCKISDIDGPVVKLELMGACSSCSASSTTMKMGIEKTLKERIPEIEEVVEVTPEQEPLTSAGVEEVLNGIRPFLSVSGGSIEIFELGDADDPKVVLKMIGPPLKSMAVRVEVQNRIKRKYPAVQEVAIVGEDGKPPSSA